MNGSGYCPVVSKPYAAVSLKAEKGLKERNRKQCKAQTKAGGVCQASAVERGLCFLDAGAGLGCWCIRGVFGPIVQW
jgi:hypothetical protein